MAAMRGKKVIVRAWENRPLVKVAWDVCKDSVLVTNEHGLTLLRYRAQAVGSMAYRHRQRPTT